MADFTGEKMDRETLIEVKIANGVSNMEMADLIEYYRVAEQGYMESLDEEDLREYVSMSMPEFNLDEVDFDD